MAKSFAPGGDEQVGVDEDEGWDAEPTDDV